MLDTLLTIGFITFLLLITAFLLIRLIGSSLKQGARESLGYLTATEEAKETVPTSQEINTEVLRQVANGIYENRDLVKSLPVDSRVSMTMTGVMRKTPQDYKSYITRDDIIYMLRKLGLLPYPDGSYNPEPEPLEADGAADYVYGADIPTPDTTPSVPVPTTAPEPISVPVPMPPLSEPVKSEPAPTVATTEPMPTISEPVPDTAGGRATETEVAKVEAKPEAQTATAAKEPRIAMTAFGPQALVPKEPELPAVREDNPPAYTVSTKPYEPDPVDIGPGPLPETVKELVQLAKTWAIYAESCAKQAVLTQKQEDIIRTHRCISNVAEIAAKASLLV